MKMSRNCAPLMAALLAACATAPQADLPDDLLESGEAFVQIRKPEADQTVTTVHSLGGQPGQLTDGSEDFFLAVRRDLLEERWFLSAYMKQYHLGGAGVAAASSLGTRVVSFREQNGKLFVFDSSDAFKSSDLFDPEILLEAYPVVDFDAFRQLRGSSRYVLIDPAAGQNKFLVTGELVADPNLADFGAFPLRVGLSYMQNFRGLRDGATFEQVFTGEVDFGGGPSTAWGTLGISLRRYQEGEGYVPTADPGTPHYFLSDSRLISGGDGSAEANPVRWNLHPGREPIQVFVTAGAQRAQVDFPDADILGAIERGIEDWNKVLGYEAFEVVFADDDEIRDDDVSTVLIDYPSTANGFAFADWRHNPNNGEILGGSVYFSGVFFTLIPDFQDDPEDTPDEGIAEPKQPETAYSFLWGGMPARRPACTYWSPQYRAGDMEKLRADASLTGPEKGSRYIEHVLSHEWGHVLGLRHNFKGSTVPPGTSVMDYTLAEDAVLLNDPGQYDIEAIQFLYQQSVEPPVQPFCTDDDTLFDPNCMFFDAGVSPLHDFWPGEYDFLTFLIFDLGFPVEFLEFGGLNEILGFARDAGLIDPADRLFAADLVLGRAKVPLADTDAADPFIAGQANAAADFVLRRMLLDGPELRGSIGADITDPGVTALVSEQARRMLVNEDGVRTFPLRRTAVDALKRLQSESALVELRSSRDTIAAALSDGSIAAADVPLTEDLLARIDDALTPYFE